MRAYRRKAGACPHSAHTLGSGWVLGDEGLGLGLFSGTRGAIKYGKERRWWKAGPGAASSE
jgi:hypothetical protein